MSLAVYLGAILLVPVVYSAVSRIWNIVSPSEYQVLQRSWAEVLRFDDATPRLTNLGYQTIHKKTGQPFIMKYWGKWYTILPMEYLPEVKRANSDYLNAPEGLVDSAYAEYRYASLLTTGHMSRLIRQKLNSKANMPLVSDALIDEVSKQLPIVFGECKDWTKSNPFYAVHLVLKDCFLRILYGEELHHDKEFRKHFDNFHLVSSLLMMVFSNIPHQGTRDKLSKPFTSYVRKEKAWMVRRICEMIEEKREHRLNFPGEQPKPDLLNWAIEYLDQTGTTPEQYPTWLLAEELIHATEAGVSGTVCFIVQMMFQVLASPEYLGFLRQEADQGIEKYGWNDALLNNLPLQDSFLREINRVYFVFTLGSNRLVKKQPFVFSNGLTLPVGARIAFPTGPSLQELPEIDDPASFDGFRWAKMAAAQKSASDLKWSATTASMDNLAFGIGSHACPGRFLTTRVTKIIFTKYLTEYDATWNRGAKGQPRRVDIQGVWTPSPFQKISLKRRPTTSLKTGWAADIKAPQGEDAFAC